MAYSSLLEATFSMTSIDFVIRWQALLLGGILTVLLVLSLDRITAYEKRLLAIIGVRAPRRLAVWWHRYDQPPLLIVRNFVVWLCLCATVISIVYIIAPLPPTILLELPRPHRHRKSDGTLLIFVHGWNGSGDNTWKAFPQLAYNDRRLKRTDILVIDYPTYMRRRGLTIIDLANWIRDSLSSVTARYNRIVLLSHSMGGIISREIVILEILGHHQPDRYVGLVSIASPYLGATHWIALAGTLGLSSSSTYALRPASPFLSDLRTQWNAVVSPPPTSCYAGAFDSIVPNDSALADCDQSVTYPYNWSHSELVKPSHFADPRYSQPIQRVVSYFHP
jgi:pimeloyl-ACP methyl ester carboxylesterase